MNDVILFHVLREIQIIGTVKTQATPLVHRYITLKGLRQVTHISQVTSDQVWINDDGTLILTNTEGDTLHQLTDVEKYKCGIHTTTISCDLIYIDDYHNINKFSIDNKTKSILIKRTAPWRRQCVYCSPSNGDLLVASTTPYTAKVTRHDDTGQHIQTIQHFNGQELYGLPAYITENRNGDIIVSDWNRYAIMVTDREGVYRFVYPEPSSSSKVELYGICTDALSNILVSDPSTSAVHMIDKDGQFLSLIQTRKLGIGGAKGLSYDEKNHLLWIGSEFNNRVCVYRYIDRQDYLTDHCNSNQKQEFQNYQTIQIMDKPEVSTECKVRQGSQCQGDTEFYCNTCKHELCIQCKERHVIDLDTIYHDVVIYREKYEYIPKQETCVRHSGRIHHLYCQSCELPICLQCKGHKKHHILDIRTAYKTNRQQNKEIIQIIRSQTLYNSCFLLAGIKTDIKTCHTEISNRQSEMSVKAQRLKNLIQNILYDVKIRYASYMMNRLKQQKRKMNRHLTSIENYEHRSEQSANRPVKFLLFLNKPRFLKIKDTPHLTQHALLSLVEEINKKDVVKLGEIQITERGKREVRNESLLKLMSTPVLQKSVEVTGVRGVDHLSFVTSDQVWVSDMYNNLILTNTAGDRLYHLTDRSGSGYGGLYTVNGISDLIYVDEDRNITKLSKDKGTKYILIKYTEPWKPRCIYCSPCNGDILVGMRNADSDTAKVSRYNDTGELSQTIHHNNSGQELYGIPRYITENRNGDVIVSDYYFEAIVVIEREGKHRFSYTGPPVGPRVAPRGVCTDALSHILVCDYNTNTIQMIDKNGQFLSLILTDQQEEPYSLGYDDRAHLLWVGSNRNNRVCVYRYIERHDHLTGNSNYEGCSKSSWTSVISFILNAILYSN
ncbi:uncharacterized protein LOC133194307 [Saccostrea echinata]|uniref:uncharacterized protein LOC133194307 n=1 Tax=Saccostrea echinata TaxID=191078 RepID=UPI002A7EB410|nr:uncharacterized protein LOC133194307 [Saccostrea echinata]